MHITINIPEHEVIESMDLTEDELIEIKKKLEKLETNWFSLKTGRDEETLIPIEVILFSVIRIIK